MKILLEKIAKLIDVKSIVTLLMTIAMISILQGKVEVNKEILMLFSSTYGSVITYFFTRKNDTPTVPPNYDSNTEIR